MLPSTVNIFVACLLPLLITIFLYFLRPPGWSTTQKLWLALTFQTPNAAGSQYHAFSVQNAYSSYRQYRRLASNQLAHMRSTYATVGRLHKRIGYEIGYPAKLNRLNDVTLANTRITDAIADLASQEFEVSDAYDYFTTTSVGTADLSRVRESLKHFMRDWSSDGAVERDRIFRPIIDVLRLDSGASSKKVLCPGTGLGRLAWEISQLGFDTTANDMSYFMILAFRFLLNPQTTSSVNQHIVHPFCYWWSHQKSNETLFRGINFPDVLPRLTDKFRLKEANFFSIPKEAQYDYVVTLFFIDTTPNILSTLEHIYTLLRPGGLWINLGPLLWASQTKLELSLEEVLHAVRQIGFELLPPDPGTTSDTSPDTPECMKPTTIDCEYTHDENAMMRWIYRAEFWVARKPLVSS